MRRSILRTAVAVVTAGLTLTACGSDDGGSSGGSGSDAATATSADDLGGMDALVKAAKAEGTLNVIALPPSWANYDEMLKTFSDKYGIKISSANPDGSSQDELDAVTSQKGQDRAPDVLDVGTSFAKQAAARTCSPPTRWRPGTTSRTTRRRPTGSGTTTTAASSRSAATPSVVAKCPTTMAELMDPQYKGQVALNGNPTQAAAAVSGVWAAALSSGGSLDDIGPGIDFFVKLKEAGNFNPVESTPATVQSGETPISLDWDYVNAGLTETLKRPASSGR